MILVVGDSSSGHAGMSTIIQRIKDHEVIRFVGIEEEEGITTMESLKEKFIIKAPPLFVAPPMVQLSGKEQRNRRRKEERKNKNIKNQKRPKS